jgi:hypothetical protein
MRLRGTMLRQNTKAQMTGTEILQLRAEDGTPGTSALLENVPLRMGEYLPALLSVFYLKSITVVLHT